LHNEKSALLNPELEEEIYKHLHVHKEELGFSKYNVFAIRDSGYDMTRFRNFDMRDQEYRSTPINYFVPTFQYFESRNAKSLRVGRHNNTCITSVYGDGVEIASINCNNPDLCDFAIFLGASRVYSTGTGVDDIGLFLRKETIYLNIAPFGTVPKSPLIKAILASDYFDGNGRRLHLKELIDEKLHKVRPTNLIKSGQISVRPKNSESILRFVSFLEENRVQMTGMEAIEAMAEMGWGEQWENVLY
jgi:putative glycosyltransferase (TIGR04372 family)